MDKFLLEVDTPPSAPARTAAAMIQKSSFPPARSKRPTAAAKRATKKHKPSTLERLLGQEPSGKKIGLSLALQKELLSGPSGKKKKQRRVPPVVHQRRPTENSTPTREEQEEQHASVAVTKRRSCTDRIQARRPLAAAAMATAHKAGWYEIPSDNRAPPASAASAAPAAAPQETLVHGGAPPSPRTQLAPPPPPPPPPPRPRPRPTTPPAPVPSAATAPLQQRQQVAVPGIHVSPPPPPPPTTLPPARTDALPAERPTSTATRPQRTVQAGVGTGAGARAGAGAGASRSRAGRMDEFFPRRVVGPSASPPPPPPPVPAQREPSSSSSRPRGWASQYARPPKVRRYARLRSRDYSSHSGEDSVDSEDGDFDGEGRGSWDPDADHLRWRGDSDDEEEDEGEGAGVAAQGGPGSSAGGLNAGAGRRPSDVQPATPAAPGPAGPSASASASGSAVAARSTARSEAAARAAAAAERRAVMSASAAAAGTGEGRDPVAARMEAAPDTALSGAALSGAVEVDEDLEAASQVAASGAAAAVVATAAASDASPGGTRAAEETQTLAEADDAFAAAAEAAAVPAAAAVAWPCRRKRGSAALFLSQRQRTGGLRCRGTAVGDAGRDTFRRQALSAVLANGLRTQRLRLGRTSNSRIGAGVVRGHPEGQRFPGRADGGVSCMEFDSEGWQLAVAGENVTVYDFDDYLPKNPPLKHTLVSGVKAYLQPTDGIHTGRTVSCVRWNPADGEQLAVSYLNFDEVHVYDLMKVSPDRPVTPVVTLLPSSSGSSGARGHLTLEFVRRGPPGNKVAHLVAGGRSGVFRVWRLLPGRVGATQLEPYLQTQVDAPREAPLRASVTAVCCLHPHAVLVGTDSGVLVAYSLEPPVLKAFGKNKAAEKLATWWLRDSAVWGDPWGDAAPDGAPGSFSVQFLRLSPDHGAGVVLCGLRSGRVVVFDTGCGRAIGITEPHRGESVGYCPPPAAAAVRPPVAPSGEAPLTQGEGAGDPYGGGHWGPAVLACCKSERAGEELVELVVLSTSARAALDSCTPRRRDRGTVRSPRKSGMRPGPGWEVGEAGGGGFRVEESGGYDLCLPVEVVAATPGQSRVRLSRDVRGYLCPRAQRRLLKSGVVTSSVMIGREKHSVEAVGADGTVLVLDRKYRGPAVGPGPGPPGGRGDGATTLPRRRAPSSNGDDGSEVDEPEPGGGSDDAEGGERSRSRVLSPPSTSATEAVPPPPATGAAAPAPAAAAAGGRAGSDQPPGQWRPNGVRVFAKLKAVFGDRRQGYRDDEDEDDDEFGARRRRPTQKETPPFALHQVVARAQLGLPVTAITSHPRNNFVLVGLSDGTVAAVLPEGKREKKKRSRRV